LPLILETLEYLRSVNGTFVERVTEWEPAVR